jgi:hypothetical protein
MEEAIFAAQEDLAPSHTIPETMARALTMVFPPVFFLLYRKLRKSAKIVYNRHEIENHITKERML